MEKNEWEQESNQPIVVVREKIKLIKRKENIYLYVLKNMENK